MAVSALYMAYLKPEKRVYQILAAKHESLALPAIRVALQSIRQQNCHALHACAQIICQMCTRGHFSFCKLIIYA